MKNRHMLLIVATLAVSANIDATSSNNIAQAVKAAHRNFVAFNKTGRVSLKQKHGIIKRTYFDVNGMKYPGSAKQWGIDKLHTKKRFWMAYSALTTLGYMYSIKQNPGMSVAAIDIVADTLANLVPRPLFAIKRLIEHSDYEGANPFSAAEEAADKAALL